MCIRDRDILECGTKPYVVVRIRRIVVVTIARRIVGPIVVIVATTVNAVVRRVGLITLP